MASVSILLQGKPGFYIFKSSEGILFITEEKKLFLFCHHRTETYFAVGAQCCQQCQVIKYGDFPPRFEEFTLDLGNFSSDLWNFGS